jgi:hypothetical protein
MSRGCGSPAEDDAPLISSRKRVALIPRDIRS